MKREEKILIVGMGYIGGFLLPGCRALLGEGDLHPRVFATKATHRDLEERRRRFPYTISVGDTGAVLERERPSIIVLSPPPTQVEEIAREILLPHYAACRRAGLPLPDLYTFAPHPSAGFFVELLGEDVLCAKLLPNVVEEVEGIPTAPLGSNFISPAPGREWPEERKSILERFLAPYGESFYLTDEDSLLFLAGKITSHICYEITDTIARTAAGLGVEVEQNALGSAIRAVHRSRFSTLCPGGEQPPALIPPAVAGVPAVLRDFVERLTVAWYDGLWGYTAGEPCSLSQKDAARLSNLSFELNVLPIQLEGWEKLQANTRNHGTKGGVLERGCIFYDRHLREPLEEAVTRLLTGGLEADFFDFVEGMGYTITLAAHRHAHRLSGRE